MPIRSPRGRAAAYRTIWQWPLRSPARLAVSAGVLLAVVLAVSAVLGRVAPDPAPTASPSSTTGTRAPQTTAPSGASRTPTPTALPPIPELTPSPLPVSSAPAAALDVAAQWAAAWVRPPDGTPPAQWLEGLRPLTTDEYLGVLATVDPSAVPATRVTGAPSAQRVAAGSVDVAVQTDALTLVVLVVLTEDGVWRVADYDRAA
ncbi:hypothetical protein I4I82_15805 [Pseudonocardia oceani]|uniref:DUF3828 domain-containing protein n=1 Tax=Pseudonocardia oceani TaxID=2792013 RepID=A0ABS6UAY5_9PSEU|nr:hypothetical protein [Pseudonocardia oceani]